MSLYLKCILASPDEMLLDNVRIFLSADHCPDFQEDVEPSKLALYQSLENIEFGAEIEVLEGRLHICWYDEESVTARQLIKALRSERKITILAFEIEDYADCSDFPDEDMKGNVYAVSNGVVKKVNWDSRFDLISKQDMEILIQDIEL